MDLGSLDFKIILNDEDFNRTVQSVISEARVLNAELSQLLTVKGAQSASVLQAKEQAAIAKEQAKTETALAKEQAKRLAFQQKQTEQLRRQKALTEEMLNRSQNSTATTAVLNAERIERSRNATIAAAEAQRKHNEMIGRSNKGLMGQSSLLRQLVALAGSYVSVMGAWRLFKDMVQVSAEFEKQRISLEAILGDLEGADHIFSQIKDLAVMSPFAFKELVSYTKQLSAYSIPMNELYETTKMLADVSAGLGVGMDRLVLAYGQIRSASFLRGQEVRQLTEAGIPILTELAKKFEQIEGRAVSVGEVFDKISRRQVTFEMVEEVFKNMTSEGGKFYQMQETLADTLSGKLSNLKDAYEIMFSEIGDKNSGFLNGTVDGLRRMIENYEKVGKVLKTIIVTYGSYKAAVMSLNAALAVGKFMGEVDAAVDAARRLGESVTWLGTAAKKAGLTFKTAFGGVIGVLGLVLTVITQVSSKAKELQESLNRITDEKFDNATQSIEKFKRLAEELRNCEEGSENYRQAISKLNQQYGDYLPNLLNEKNALDQLASSYNNVVASISAKARAASMEEGLTEIYKKADADMRKYTANVSNWLSQYAKVPEDVTKSIMSQFTERLKQDAKPVKEVWNDVVNSFFAGTATRDSNEKRYLLSLGTFNGVGNDLLQYANVVRKTKKEVDDFTNSIEQLYYANTAFYTEDERTAINAIEAEYSRGLEVARNTKMSEEEFTKKTKELQKKRLEDLIAFYDKSARVTANGETNIYKYNTGKVKEYQAMLDELTKVSTGWRKAVNDLLEKDYKSYRSMFGAQETDMATDYIDKLVKDYKAAQEDLRSLGTGKVLAAETEPIKERLKVMKDIAKALGVSLDTLSASKTAKNPAITNLENEARAITALQSAFSQLNGYLKGEDMKNMLKILFPDYAGNERTKSLFDLDFKNIVGENTATEKLQQIIDRLRTLGEAGEEAAERLQNSVGKRDANYWANVFALYQDYREQMQKWIDKDFNVNGTGVAFDISKLFANMVTDNNQVNTFKEKMQNMLDEATENIEVKDFVIAKYGEEFWESYITNGESAIEELANREIEYNKKVAQEKIDDMASRYVNELLQANNITLSDWGDKSLSQVTALKSHLEDILKGVTVSSIGLSDDDVKLLEKEGLTLETLILKIKNLIGKDIDETTEEEAKKIASRLSGIGKEIQNLGKAAGSTFLSGLGNAMSEFESRFGEAMELFNKGDVKEGMWSTVFQGIMKYAEGIAEAVTYAVNLKRAIADARAESAKLSLSLGTESIFGDNLQRKLDNATAIIAAYSTLVKEDTKAVNNTMQYATAFSKAFDNIGSMMAPVALLANLDKAFDLGIGRRKKTLQQLADSVGGELMNEYGVLNSVTLQAILNTYTDLDKADREWLENASRNAEVYTEALKQLDDVMSELVGSLSSDAADAMIEQWKTMGNLAADYGDIIDDVATKYAKMILQDTLLTQVFNDDFKKRLTEFTKGGDAVGAVSIISDAFDSLSSLEPFFIDVLSGLDQFFNTNSSTSTGATLSEGIKSINEQQADLLASYVNAIRADVSYNKGQIAEISGDVKQLLALFPTAPNFEDYLMQIQANTFNTAENTREMLSALRSVIGDGSEGSAIKVLM